MKSSTPSSAATGPLSKTSSATCCCRCFSTRRWPPKPVHFTIEDVIAGLNRKLIRRHPHVFGEAAAAAAGNSATGLDTENIDARQVLHNWEEIKKLEQIRPSATRWTRTRRTSRHHSALHACALRSRQARLQRRQIRIRLAGCLRPHGQAARRDRRDRSRTAAARRTTRQAITEELGDLLFTAVNLARHLKIDPELALRDTNAKFRRRFRSMETASPHPLEELAPDELESLWNRAKLAESKR